MSGSFPLKSNFGSVGGTPAGDADVRVNQKGEKEKMSGKSPPLKCNRVVSLQSRQAKGKAGVTNRQAIGCWNNNNEAHT